MTKKEMFVKIKNRVADDAEMVAFIDHEIELLNKKRGSSKPTATQKANEDVMNRIVEVLSDVDERMTATEIVKALDNEFTIQKVSALLKILVDRGQVAKAIEKKVAYFSLA